MRTLPSDYSRCTGTDCPHRETCLRWLCWQEADGERCYSWIVPDGERGQCMYLIPAAEPGKDADD